MWGLAAVGAVGHPFGVSQVHSTAVPGPSIVQDHLGHTERDFASLAHPLLIHHHGRRETEETPRRAREAGRETSVLQNARWSPCRPGHEIASPPGQSSQCGRPCNRPQDAPRSAHHWQPEVHGGKELFCPLPIVPHPTLLSPALCLWPTRRFSSPVVGRPVIQVAGACFCDGDPR